EADLFTVPVNLAGLTAISVPLYNDITLPIGLQIIGDKFREEDVLKFGLAIERLVK
ncbi:MAG: Asp-tRNA(Asn)/Glu-tRNA(Gln) amidotransferase subunit GatA, partial [Tissierellia bacterium]|nr:Asp-tRNA(Asn)/Glu-tRNA(Gln) amidotransferase subunit GatA [Tissierellia bacterium]